MWIFCLFHSILNGIFGRNVSVQLTLLNYDSYVFLFEFLIRIHTNTEIERESDRTRWILYQVNESIALTEISIYMSIDFCLLSIFNGLFFRCFDCDGTSSFVHVDGIFFLFRLCHAYRSSANLFSVDEHWTLNILKRVCVFVKSSAFSKIGLIFRHHSLTWKSCYEIDKVYPRPQRQHHFTHRNNTQLTHKERKRPKRRQNIFAISPPKYTYTYAH